MISINNNVFDELNEENFLLFAMTHYKNRQCNDIKEFYNDLSKIKNIKKQLNRYIFSDAINERLFLNNIILFFNVFEIDAACVMLIFKIPQKCWSPLKTALNFLGYLNPKILSDIDEDNRLKDLLDKL